MGRRIVQNLFEGALDGLARNVESYRSEQEIDEWLERAVRLAVATGAGPIDCMFYERKGILQKAGKKMKDNAYVFIEKLLPQKYLESAKERILEMQTKGKLY